MGGNSESGRTNNTVYIDHIQFDRVARRNLVLALKTYLHSNTAVGAAPDFNIFRRILNDWLEGKSYYVHGLNKPFPERVHENFFANLCPSGAIDDIVEKNTYSKQSVMLHLVATFLENVPYLQLLPGWLHRHNSALDVGLASLEFLAPGEYLPPMPEMQGMFSAKSDITTWRRFGASPDAYHFISNINEEETGHEEGRSSKKPVFDNIREIGIFSFTRTIDCNIFDASFSEMGNGRNRINKFSGIIYQTRTGFNGIMKDREDNELDIYLSSTLKDNVLYIAGVFVVSTTSGNIILTKQNAEEIDFYQLGGRHE